MYSITCPIIIVAVVLPNEAQIFKSWLPTLYVQAGFHHCHDYQEVISIRQFAKKFQISSDAIHGLGFQTFYSKLFYHIRCAFITPIK